MQKSTKPDISIGDLVVMNDKYMEGQIYKGRIWTVRTEPKYIKNTGWVCMLDGLDIRVSCDGLSLVR